MTNKLSFIILFILAVLIWSSTIVEERECFVVFNKINNHYSILNKGIHFIWPLIESYEIIYLNEYNSEFSSNFTLNNNDIVKANILITWKVKDIITYYQNLVTHTEINSLLFDQNIKDFLNKLFINSSLTNINDTINLINSPIYLKSLGVTVTSITLLDFNLNKKLITTKIDNIRISYDLAHKIKLDSDIDSFDKINSIQVGDEKFYNLYKKLDIYKNSAKSVSDVPDIKSLY